MRPASRSSGWGRGDRNQRKKDVNERDYDGQITGVLVPLDPFRLTAQDELAHHKLGNDQKSRQDSENQQKDFHRAIHSMVSDPSWTSSTLFFNT